MNKDILQEKIKKSLFYSIVEGSFWSIMYGFGETYIAAFAIFLMANNFQIALLASLPLLMGSLSQFFAVKLIDMFKSRKKFVVATAAIQALTWLPIMLVFYINKWSIYFLIAFAVVYFISGMISAPAWNSWIGDLVNPEQRGIYFGKRSKIIGLISLISIVGAGIILDMFKDGASKQYIGFVIIFSLALAARLLSAFFLNKKYEPEFKVKKEKGFSFLTFLKQIRYNNYGLFVVFLCLMNFSVYVAGPFFAAYWLYDLKLSYSAYMIIISAAFVTRYISLPAWGFLSDRYGTKKILNLTGYLMPITPILWMLSTNYYILVLIQFYSGIVWAGFELSSFNFIFDTTTASNRARCISYYNILNGIAIFAGALLGSIFVQFHSLFWSKYYIVFLISGLLRYSVSIAFLPRLKEARKVSEISNKKIFFKLFNMLIVERFNHSLLLSYPRKLMFFNRK